MKTNPVFEFLDGKSYALDGIDGTFQYEITQRGENRLHHRPSEVGRQSLTYRQIKARLGDDWSTDLTDDIEAYCKVATELGYQV